MSPIDDLGARLVGHFLDRWEGDDALIVLLRSSTTNADAAQRMREMFVAQLKPAVTSPGARGGGASSGIDRDADARSGAVPLCAAATAGRRLSRDEIVAWLGPTIQRYLTGSAD